MNTRLLLFCCDKQLHRLAVILIDHNERYMTSSVNMFY